MQIRSIIKQIGLLGNEYLLNHTKKIGKIKW